MDLEQVNILWKDMRAEVYAVQAWVRDDPDSDLRKRVFVRSMAAFVEACINSLAEAVVTQVSNLTAGEYAILSETQFGVVENGLVQTRPRFYPTISRWRLLVRVVERRLGTSHWHVNFADAGFTLFKRLFEVRNRITHPRVSSSMKIEFEEIDACIGGFLWFISNYQGLCNVRAL